ncbi:HlyD family efflux transporter periplasmic adaptor subunit [Bengtsoniella intestinalis]|uniref:efflux RND transporter periplasmic adaptor subunit n=1 Tax=Bengtsoniella intestinalis TaxID=3073143 RepID=UPI00391F1AA7
MNETPVKKKVSKKLRRRIVALLVIAGMAGGGYYYVTKDTDEVIQTAVTDIVYRGDITATVEGSGLTKAKNTESISLNTAGTVLDLFVSDGDKVMAGDPLFVVDSAAAVTAVKNAQNEVDGYQSQLNALYKDMAGLNLSPSYAGKLMDVVTLNAGDEVSKGQTLATLADDTRLRLELYFSYAYEGQIKTGQTAQVSIPALTSSLAGTVEAVHMVSRITDQGSKLFVVHVLVENPGTLTDGMVATATVDIGGETAYPYESGTLAYYRTGELTSTVSGTVISSKLVNFLPVTQGQTLVVIDGEDVENERFTIEQNLDNALEDLEKAQENLANTSAVAPMNGTVLGLSVGLGDSIDAGATILTIADTDTIIVDATVDERNVSFVKAGMWVDIDQWGNYFGGMVDSVSLTSDVSNGVASFPMVISVDNYDGALVTGSYVSYSLMASQSQGVLLLPLQSVKSVTLPDESFGTVVFVAGERPENAVDLPYPPEDVPEGYWAVPVVTGIADNYNVEIKSGVEEGMEVFTQMMTQSSWDMGGMMY